ncbi:MAG: hypothetical protein KIT79_09990 [Deltaproteobacteria bacterium]|nr:hypothetical protein [Deltaproteobacteria bacterium]
MTGGFLHPADLKRHLLNPDKFVREWASIYFGSALIQDTDLPVLIMEAVERYGELNSFFSLAKLDVFPQTERSVSMILSRLEKVRRQETAECLNRALALMPLDLVPVFESRMKAVPALHPMTHERIARRREYRSRRPPELFDELLSVSLKYEGKPVPPPEFARTDDLIEAIAAQDWPPSGKLVEMLREPDYQGRWAEYFIVKLCGTVRSELAVPLIVAQLASDDDFLPDAAQESLYRIGYPGTPGLIRSLWHKLPDELSRMMSAYTFAGFKSPASAAAVLELLELEDDPSLRTILLDSLAYLGSDRAVAIGCEELDDLDEAVTGDLILALYGAAKIRGLEVPEAAAWKNELEENNRRFNKEVFGVGPGSDRPLRKLPF